VWGWDYEGDRGVVETYVFYLRKKLGRAAYLVHTVRGIGYALRED
jgi:two-component system OmpR family response regulator